MKKNSVKSARVAGRPWGDDAVGRQAIIDAAITLLKSRTAEEMSILEVAKLSGVSRTLVRYYFGDLKGLLREVTEQLMQQLQDAQFALKQQVDLKRRIRQRLMLLIEFMAEHPQFQRLALTEIYYADSGVGTHRAIADLGVVASHDSQAVETALQRITRRGLKLTDLMLEGVSKDRLDRRYVHLTILGIAAFVATTRPLLSTLFGDEKARTRHIKRYVEFVSEMLDQHIKKT